jgi:hypothetical protein
MSARANGRPVRRRSRSYNPGTGGLASQVWSFAGPDERSAVSLMSVQYFVNYNLEHAWYLTSSPILTFNWKAASSEEWVVPFGGGVGKIFKLGKVPFNGSVQAYYNVRPEDTQTIGSWQARIQLALLLPTKKPPKKPAPANEEQGSASAQLAPIAASKPSLPPPDRNR